MKLTKINQENIKIANIQGENASWILRNLNGFPINRLSEISGEYKFAIESLKNDFIYAEYNNIEDATCLDPHNKYINIVSEDGLSAMTTIGNTKFKLIYDEKGRVIERVDLSTHSKEELLRLENSCDQQDISFIKKYDDNNNIIYYSLANKEYEEITDITYKDLSLTKFTTVKTNGKVSEHRKVIKETNGDIMAKTTILFNSLMKEELLFKEIFDKNNNKIYFYQKEREAPSGLTPDIIITKKYDSKNRLIQKIKNPDTKKSIENYKYNDFNQVISTEFISGDKTSFKIENFDERGNFISTSYKNMKKDEERESYKYDYSIGGGFVLLKNNKEILSVPDFK